MYQLFKLDGRFVRFNEQLAREARTEKIIASLRCFADGTSILVQKSSSDSAYPCLLLLSPLLTAQWHFALVHSSMKEHAGNRRKRIFPRDAQRAC
jgi:hypothetical protein